MADMFVFEDYKATHGRVDQVAPVASREEHINPSIGTGFAQPAPYQNGVPVSVSVPLSDAFIDFSFGAATATVNNGTNVPLNVPAMFCEGFGGDLFERMHVIETFYDLGVVLGIQVQTFEIWNAYRSTTVELTSIGEIDTTGITLFDDPVGGFGPPPASFPPRSSSNSFLNVPGGEPYSFLVTRVGPAEIDATYQFNFDTGPTVDMNIVGVRIVVWPHEPQNGVNEELAYKTVLLTAYDGSEQRIRSRKIPRQSYGMRYFITDPQEVREARNRMIGQLGNQFALPLWQFARQLTSDIAANATIIPVLTTNADFRDTTSEYTSLVCLWRAYNDFETVQLVNGGLGASQLQIELPGTVNAYNAIDTYVIPLQVAVATDQLEWDRNISQGYLDMRFSWLAQDVFDHGDLSSLPVHDDDGFPILADPNFVGLDTGIGEGLNRQVTVIESPQGAFETKFGRTTPLFDARKGWQTDDDAAAWVLRQILYGLRGRQKTFHLPTFGDDFIVTDDIAASDTSVKVEPTGLATFVGAQQPWAGIMVEKFDGTRAFRNLDDVLPNVGPPIGELLVLTSPFGVGIAQADIRRCSFVNLVRMNTDKIRIEHERRGVVRVTVPVVGVPQ